MRAGIQQGNRVSPFGQVPGQQGAGKTGANYRDTPRYGGGYIRICVQGACEHLPFAAEARHLAHAEAFPFKGAANPANCSEGCQSCSLAAVATDLCHGLIQPHFRVKSRCESVQKPGIRPEIKRFPGFQYIAEIKGEAHPAFVKDQAVRAADQGRVLIK